MIASSLGVWADTPCLVAMVGVSATRYVYTGLEAEVVGVLIGRS